MDTVLNKKYAALDSIGQLAGEARHPGLANQ
jgi:hypothetical protein